MKKITALTCEIVRDLLPLYHDHVVSEETAAAVENHLEGCDGCRKEYEELCREEKLIEKTVVTDKKWDFINAVKQIRHKGQIRGVLIMTVIVIIGIAGWVFLTTCPVVAVDMDDYTIENVYRYDFDRNHGDGLFFVISGPFRDYISITVPDSTDGEQLQYEVKRPIISKKRQVVPFEMSLEIGEDVECVTVNDKEVWNQSEGYSENVPEYVDEYNKCEWPGNDEKYIGAEAGIMSDGSIQINYPDGSEIIWDSEGNVIEERTGDEE